MDLTFYVDRSWSNILTNGMATEIHRLKCYATNKNRESKISSSGQRYRPCFIKQSLGIQALLVLPTTNFRRKKNSACPCEDMLLG
jgi:hypothetical protein